MKHPPPAGGTLFTKEGRIWGRLMRVHIVLDGIAHLLKREFDLSVGETQYMQSKAFKKIGADFIIFHATVSEVLVPVNLYDQLHRETIEINNIVTYCFLPRKTARMFAQKLIPQLILLRRPHPPQLLRPCFQFPIIW